MAVVKRAHRRDQRDTLACPSPASNSLAQRDDAAHNLGSWLRHENPTGSLTSPVFPTTYVRSRDRNINCAPHCVTRRAASGKPNLTDIRGIEYFADVFWGFLAQIPA
jgi:hypothetical protein